MQNSNHYDTLDVNPAATSAEIKQAYRRLAKLFHPDSNLETSDHEKTIRINAAYEVLRDPHRRQSYDQQLLQRRYTVYEQTPYPVYEQTTYTEASRTAQGSYQHQQQRHQHQQQHQQQRHQHQQQHQQQRHQQQHRAPWQTGQNADEQLQRWLKQVYTPVNRLLCRILNPLIDRLDKLSADPFDDELMEEFQDYVAQCRQLIIQAQKIFRSQPNPATAAGAAVHLYYCLEQVSDGIEELRLFTLNYDDHYLHTGQELFRIATGLHCEARDALKDIA